MKQSLEEVIDEIKAERKDNGKLKYKQFTRKNFEKVCRAIANDPDFKTQAATYVASQGELSVDDIAVSAPFRAWLKKILESFGIDKTESELVMGDDFEVPAMDWAYNFFATVLWEFISSGNKFQMIPKEDFAGKLFIKELDEKVSVTKTKNIQTGEYLGDIETTSKKRRALGVDASCPEYLKVRRKL